MAAAHLGRQAGAVELLLERPHVAGLVPGRGEQLVLVVAHHTGTEPRGGPPARVEVQLGQPAPAGQAVAAGGPGAVGAAGPTTGSSTSGS